MSKVLRRPMFRIGGSANDGIISLAQPRKNYQGGSEDYITRREEIRPLYKEAIGPGRSERDRFLDMLLRGSIRLASERPVGGGIIPTIAKSFQDPVEQYLKSGETEEALQRQIDLTATTQAISSVDAERLARLKLKAENEEAIIAQKAKELQAIGMSPGLARVMNNYEKATGNKVFPIPLQPKDPRGFAPSELTQIPVGGTFIDSKGNFFRKLDTGKVVQVDPNTDKIIEPKAPAPKELGFFEKYGRKALKRRGEELIDELNRIRQQKEIIQKGE